jgi:asparagine synthase (glutamine-hydrolysing)
MCGIAGFIDFKQQGTDDLLRQMTDTIVHRGPDDSGQMLYTSPTAQVGFGFRRLAIIELSELGHQPMEFETAGLSIIFNGEVYNYAAIRKELEALGYTFRSHSDTEVILKSYAQWGTECVHRFIGMFAIAIYDRPQNKVVLFRDRAGVKPLFYSIGTNKILFGSELKVLMADKSFKKEINFSALALYFQRGYISAPHTIFNNTYKLLPGHYLTIDLSTQQTALEKYWDVTAAYNQPKLDVSYEEAKAEVEKLMLSAFQYRMVADVPVGIFLSGGYDSTAVAAMLQKNSTQKIKTFTIGFEDPKFNEAHHAKNVADHLGTDHYEHICTYQDALSLITELPDIYDEPFGDTSAIPTTLVSRMAREQVTVALSADGGDEIFAGYPKYFNAAKRIEQLKFLKGNSRSLSAKLFSLLQTNGNISRQNKMSKLTDFAAQGDEVARFDIISQAMSFYETQQLINQPITALHTPFQDGALLNSDNDLLSKFQATEYKTYMVDDILQKVDRATMSVSLEGREPFLDQRIIEYAARLPAAFKYKDGIGKYILKDIVHQYVPKAMMERPKMGFGVPLEKWLRHELKDVLLEVLNEKELKEQNIFNVARVMQLRDDYLAGKPVEFQRLSYLFLFQLWYKKWMK